MDAAKVGSIVIVGRAAADADSELVLGILTLTDLIGRVILPQLPLTTEHLLADKPHHVVPRTPNAALDEKGAGRTRELTAAGTSSNSWTAIRSPPVQPAGSFGW